MPTATDKDHCDMVVDVFVNRLCKSFCKTDEDKCNKAINVFVNPLAWTDKTQIMCGKADTMN